jgi:RHS repeat-associated protein
MSGASVVARHDFLPFGEELAAGTGLRTTGQGFGVEDEIRQRYGLTERDDSTGLDHTWWRKYENRAGRWTSADPYRGSMTTANPQSFNGYAHVQNDPVNFVDPTGLVRVWCVAYPIGDGHYSTHCFEFPDPLFPREPNPRGGGRGSRNPKPTQAKLTPGQKKAVWQRIYQDCLSRKELERKAALREREREASRHFTTACIVGYVVGAVEGGLEFGPLGIPLGGAAGCVIGTTEQLIPILPILAMPKGNRVWDKSLGRASAERDCKEEADRIVSKL